MQEQTDTSSVTDTPKMTYFTATFFRSQPAAKYEGWNFNSGNYLFTTDTK